MSSTSSRFVARGAASRTADTLCSRAASPAAASTAPRVTLPGASSTCASQRCSQLPRQEVLHISLCNAIHVQASDKQDPVSHSLTCMTCATNTSELVLTLNLNLNLKQPAFHEHLLPTLNWAVVHGGAVTCTQAPFQWCRASLSGSADATPADAVLAESSCHCGAPSSPPSPPLCCSGHRRCRAAVLALR